VGHHLLVKNDRESLGCKIGTLECGGLLVGRQEASHSRLQMTRELPTSPNLSSCVMGEDADSAGHADELMVD